MIRTNSKKITLLNLGGLLMILWLAAVLFTPRNTLLAATAQQTDAAAGQTVYVVQRGDTLSAIARRFTTTVAALVKLNNIRNPSLIYVGQRLLIPGGPTPTPTPTPLPTNVWAPPANAIEQFSPVAAGVYHSPVEVIGYSQTFEGNVNLRLTGADGTVLAERNTLGGSVDGFRFFHAYLRFTVSEEISATLEVFETSAKDGSEINKVTTPLILLPGQRVIDLNAPGVGATVCSPISVRGYSSTFEANVVTTLSQRNGTQITQALTNGGNFGVYQDFSATLTYTATTAQPLLISAYDTDASGLGDLDRTVVPVSFYPAGSGGCP